jgi:NTE family protein
MVLKRVGGTSSGAIIALTISLGYSGKEIENIISKQILKIPMMGFFLYWRYHRLNKYFGWYKGKKIEKWLEKVIKEKTEMKILRLKSFIKKVSKICI